MVQFFPGKGGEPKNQLITPVKKPGRPPQSVFEGESIEDIVNIPVVIGLESNGVANARIKKSNPLDSQKSSVKQINGQKEYLADSETPTLLKDKVGNSSEWGTLSSQKRKRGRPPKVLAQRPTISVAVNKQNGDASKQKNTLSSVMKISFSKKDKLMKEKSALASVGGKRGKRRALSLNTESSNQDLESVSKGKADERLEKDGASRKDDVGIDALLSDDEPLSMWFEGMHANISGASVGISNKEKQRAEGGESSGDIQRLPFVKNSPLWETIGSMEVFRMIPQRPHFRPLDGHKESCREGLAIGNMVTFASVVEKTTSMQFDEPKSTIEDYLETVLELENHGFNVNVVRDQLKGLLEYKRKHEELEKEGDGIRSRIGEHSVETSKVDEEIEEIEKEIRELEEKRSLALTRKEMNKSEMACLEKQLEGVNEGIWGIRSGFDELASSPWHGNPK